MPICCDTSFLFSTYASDAHTGKALAQVKRTGKSIHISVLNQYELENALRLAVFRKLLPAAEAANILADFEADMATGRLILTACNLASVIAEARRLSMRYTLNQGYRAFDILHVGAALHLKATLFFSFDEQQRKLARAEGLRVEP